MDKKAPYTPELMYDNNVKVEDNKRREAELLKQLTLSLSQGDSKAWEQIYLHVGDSLVSFLRYILHSEDDAFDVAQEVFISLWENHERIDPQKASKAIFTLWLKDTPLITYAVIVKPHSTPLSAVRNPIKWITQARTSSLPTKPN